MSSTSTTHVRLDRSLHARLVQLSSVTFIPVTRLLDALVREGLPRLERHGSQLRDLPPEKRPGIIKPDGRSTPVSDEGVARAHAAAVQARREASLASIEANAAIARRDYERARAAQAGKAPHEQVDEQGRRLVAPRPSECDHQHVVTLSFGGRMCKDCGVIVSR